MYRIGVMRDFVAWHFLTVDDAGPEGELHAHRYRLELALYGRTLDRSGYLADLDAVRAFVDEAVARYGDAALNDLPEFAGLNPSLEHFARILGESVARTADPARIERVRVVLWEGDEAWAGWEGVVGDGRAGDARGVLASTAPAPGVPEPGRRGAPVPAGRDGEIDVAPGAHAPPPPGGDA